METSSTQRHTEVRKERTMPQPKRLHKVTQKSAATSPDEEIIAARAYQIWLERGCPIGSDQQDWFKAVEELKNEAKRAA